MFTALQSIKLQKLQSIFKESFPQRSNTSTHSILYFKFVLAWRSLLAPRHYHVVLILRINFSLRRENNTACLKQAAASA